MDKKIRFGIIGAGNIGPLHAEVLSMLDNAELVAVATTKEETAKSLAESYKIKSWYTDYQKLLQREDIEAVDICTPPFLHKEMVISTARARKHVIVEKPMALSLKEADEMIEECEKAGVKLGVIFQSRFHKNAQKIKQTIDAGRFGDLLMGDAYVKWYRNQDYYNARSWRGIWSKEGGGVVISQAIHAIDLLQWFMGEVNSVDAFISTRCHKIEVEDIAIVMVKFKNGALGIIEASTCIYPQFQRRLELHGAKGTVILQGNDIIFWDFVDLKEKERLELEKRGRLETVTPKTCPPIECHKIQIKDFINAIKENRKPLVDGIEGRKSLKIVQAIYKAARTGKVVKL